MKQMKHMKHMRKNMIIALILGVCMMFPQAVYAYNSGYDGSSFPADVNAERARLQGIWAHPGYGSKGQITEAAEIYYFHGDTVTVYLAYSEAYPSTLSPQNREGTYTYEISELYETFPQYNQVDTGWRIMIDRPQEEYEYWDIREYWDPEKHDEKQ